MPWYNNMKYMDWWNLRFQLVNHASLIPSTADQTPTPTKFLKNCDEIGLFQDLSKNPFDEAFKRAINDSSDAVSDIAVNNKLISMFLQYYSYYIFFIYWFFSIDAFLFDLHLFDLLNFYSILIYCKKNDSTNNKLGIFFQGMPGPASLDTPVLSVPATPILLSRLQQKSPTPSVENSPLLSDKSTKSPLLSEKTSQSTSRRRPHRIGKTPLIIDRTHQAIDRTHLLMMDKQPAMQTELPVTVSMISAQSEPENVVSIEDPLIDETVRVNIFRGFE